MLVPVDDVEVEPDEPEDEVDDDVEDEEPVEDDDPDDVDEEEEPVEDEPDDDVGGVEVGGGTSYTNALDSKPL